MLLHLLLPAAIAFVPAALLWRAEERREARAVQWYSTAQPVTGTLTRCARYGGDDEADFHCAVEYAIGSQRYAITGSFDFTPDEIGREVEVMFQPALPSDARLAADNRRDRVAQLLATVGVFGIVYFFSWLLLGFALEIAQRRDVPQTFTIAPCLEKSRLVFAPSRDSGSG